MDKTRNHAARRTGLGLAVMLALCASPGAQAAASFGSGCNFNGGISADGATGQSMSGDFCSGGLLETRGTVVDQVWTGEDYVTQGFEQHARTGVSGSAGLGELHAYSNSFAKSTPMAKEFYYSNGEPGIIENMYKAQSQSRLSAYWFDELTVNSGPTYGRVVLRFTITLHGQTTVVEGSRGAASFSTRLIADDDRYPDDLSITLNDTGTLSRDGGYWPGTKIRLYGDLSASTDAYAGRIYNYWYPAGYVAESEATANASRTAGFQVEVLTPGASVTTASGRSYAAMVPEPTSTAMAGAGLAGVLLMARRRRQGRPTGSR
ncbi:MAG: PEP-CTERM sorting domain-containing protein [Acidobacteriota bacterium]